MHFIANSTTVASQTNPVSPVYNHPLSKVGDVEWLHHPLYIYSDPLLYPSSFRPIPMLPPSRHANVISCLSACLQDDIVHEDLTVRENLEYSAWLRNPKYMRTRAKGDLVDDVINVLNLRSVQHSVVGTAEKRGIRCVCPSVIAERAM